VPSALTFDFVGKAQGFLLYIVRHDGTRTYQNDSGQASTGRAVSTAFE
jgi:hypothetical protein